MIQLIGQQGHQI